MKAFFTCPKCGYASLPLFFVRRGENELEAQCHSMRTLCAATFTADEVREDGNEALAEWMESFPGTTAEEWSADDRVTLAR
jgi:hypothetical protein